MAGAPLSPVDNRLPLALAPWSVRSQPESSPSIWRRSARASRKSAAIRRRLCKAKAVIDPEERDRREVILGVTTFALAIFVILFAFGSYAGWSPSQYIVEM